MESSKFPLSATATTIIFLIPYSSLAKYYVYITKELEIKNLRNSVCRAAEVVEDDFGRGHPSIDHELLKLLGKRFYPSPGLIGFKVRV